MPEPRSSDESNTEDQRTRDEKELRPEFVVTM